ncbi:hypothetical protein CVT25_010416 [Psilocybe cyanescens]|uniref:Uncharacterized protein n=1 Tax=Psilocybe cyanescens TaxID=93625 RepID=A0A409X2Q6_PSICY|nr:hypothetical protein CVT25_010416 [Psilocybe cyanescens]
MSPLASEALIKTINLSQCDGPSDATVVVVPLPKNTVAIVFGQMIAEWKQRFNTYLLDTDNIVIDPQVVWDATTNGSRFDITKVVPQSIVPPDPHVFSIGPYSQDYNIAVYCSHKRPGAGSFAQSDPRHTFNSFKIGSKNAVTFTMVHAEDGGDTDYHDTVVGVAVNYLTK